MLSGFGDVQLLALLAAAPIALFVCAILYVLWGAKVRRRGRPDGGGHPRAGGEGGEGSQPRVDGEQSTLKSLFLLYKGQVLPAVIPWCAIPLILGAGRLRPVLSRSWGVDLLSWLDFSDVGRSTAWFAVLTALDVGLCYGAFLTGRRRLRHVPQLSGPVAIVNYLVAGAYICVVAWSTMIVLHFVVLLGYG